MSRPLSQRLSPTNVEKYKISIKTLADEVNSQFDLKGETLTPKQNGNTTIIPQLALPKKEKRKSIGEAYTEDVTEYRKQLLYYIKQTRKQYIPPKLIRSTPSSPVDIARPEGNNVTELLHYACAVGDEGLLVELLQKEAAQREKMDVNTSFLDKATNHCTLLHKAARYDQVGIMKILFDFGALVEILDSLESTPLFYTAAGNAVQACEYLLAKHAQVNIRNQFEQSPLLIALKNGNFEIANALLLAKADIHFKGTSGQTCLHLACEEGSIEKVKFLLAQGASITRTNRDDETCLFSAIQHPPIVYAICDHVKTTQNENRLIALIRARNNRGMTVLCRAAVEGYLDTFLVLINRIPANTKSSPNLLPDLINERSKQHNQTMLHLAVHYNRHEIVRLLMVSTETDFSKVMANGDTVLHYAIREKKDEDMIVMLIRADPVCTKIRNHERDTPKMIAKKMGLEEKYEDWFRMASIGSSDIVTIKSDKNVIPIRAITPRTPRSSAFDSPKTVSPKKAEQRKSIKNYFARRKTLALERVDVEKPRASESRPAVARKRSAFRFEDTLLESLKIPSEQITVTVENEPEKKPMSISEPDQDTDYLKVKRISNELGTVFAQDESNVYRIGFLVGSLMEISTRLFEKELQIMDYDTSRVSEQHRNFTEKIFDFHSLCLADLATRQVKNEFAKFLKGWVDTHEPVQQEIKRRSSMRLGLDTITDTGTSYDEDSIVEPHD